MSWVGAPNVGGDGSFDRVCGCVCVYGAGA